jgi:FlaG/FlaF family flagellin (archaellin)
MGLRSFHLFFIAVSIVLAAFVAAWAVGEYRTAHDSSYIAAAIGSLGAAAALTMYVTVFQKKTKGL